jgi:two-component system response regulator RegX3
LKVDPPPTTLRTLTVPAFASATWRTIPRRVPIANLRRAGIVAKTAKTDVLNGGAVEMDVARHVTRVRGEPIDLTPKEFDLLKGFLIGLGRLRTRGHLIAEVWGPDYFGDTKTLDVHVKRLRQKIESDPHKPGHLVTVRGLGYRFIDQP